MVKTTKHEKKQTNKQTYYNTDWENESIHPQTSSWVSGTKGSTSFGCRVCPVKTSRSLGNMGKNALIKHMNSTVHKDAMGKGAGLRQPSLSSFVQPLQSSPQQANSLPVSSQPTSTSSDPASIVKSPAASPFHTPSLQAKRTTIFIALKCVMAKLSYRCVEDLVVMFKIMFPDSEIPDQLQLKRTKLKYIIQFGLAVYYRKMLFGSLIPTSGAKPNFVLCFDEAFNRVSKRKQMDVHINYFNEEKEKVVRSYAGASFMGHALADHTVTSIQKVTGELDLVHNLLQVSMDGPNVNWSALSILNSYRKQEDPDCHSLLNIGSCGLHVLHGAYGTAQDEVKWNVGKYCKSIYSIFKKAPARREDYLSCNELLESHDGKDVSYLFPEKFCGHRWLENGKTLDRAIVTYSNMQSYVKWLTENKKIPKNDNRFELLIEKLGEKLFRAELEFSLYMAKIIEPFLEMFQAERPLAVFLYEELSTLFDTLLSKVVKSDVLEQNSSMKEKMKISLLKKEKGVGTLLVEGNLKPVENIKIGYGAERFIKKKTKTVDALEVKIFKGNCRRFYAVFLEKLKERSPLNYQLTSQLSSLSPTQILKAQKDVLVKKFGNLCLHLVTNGVVTAATADKAEESYTKFIADETVRTKLAEFDLHKDRLDELYLPLLKSSKELREIVKIVLVLSHGNARVESGFSINKDIEKDNLKEETLIAHRVVFDGVLNEGGISKVEITKDMMKEVDNSRKRYHQWLDVERERQTAGEKRKQEKRKITTAITKAKQAKAALTTEMLEKQAEVEREIAQLEQQLRK